MPNILPFEDMDATEYEQIRDYLSSQLIPPEMKSEKEFSQEVQGYIVTRQQTDEGNIWTIYSADKLFTYAIGNIRLSRRRME